MEALALPVELRFTPKQYFLGLWSIVQNDMALSCRTLTKNQL